MPSRTSATRAVRAVGHEDRLTLIEHLDELRSRLIFCAVTLALVFAVCLWQNDALLNIINQPLSDTTQASIQKGDGIPGQINESREGLLALAGETLAMSKTLSSTESGLPKATRDALTAQQAQIQKTIDAIPKTTEGNKPVTLRVGEPFSTTLTVALYFALLISLPLLLYQAYAFVLPAFTPSERRVALPLMAMVPFLFIAGVVFGYFVVLPPAVQFLQNFNSEQFNILVQASDYYKFAVMALIGMGLVFQLPVGVLAATKLGIVTPKQLAQNRRYAIVVIAVIAMLLPGVDPVTMLINMVPLLLLYELSIVLARFAGKPVISRGDDDDDDDGTDGDDGHDDPAPDPSGGQDVLVPVGADWDPEEGHGDDDWEDRPARRDTGRDGDLS
jgi:sec-independent protein translocase protein TatC